MTTVTRALFVVRYIVSLLFYILLLLSLLLSSLPPSLPPSPLQYENLQRDYWRLLDENQRLLVQCMEGEKVALFGNRRSGDDDHSAKSTYVSELGFQRPVMRQTYHFGERLQLFPAYFCCDWLS